MGEWVGRCVGRWVGEYVGGSVGRWVVGQVRGFAASIRWVRDKADTRTKNLSCLVMMYSR